MKKKVITREFKCSKCGAYCGIPEGHSINGCEACKTKDSLVDLNKTREIEIDYEKKTVKGLPKGFDFKWPKEGLEVTVKDKDPIVGVVSGSGDSGSWYAYFCTNCGYWRCIPFYYPFDPIICYVCQQNTCTLTGGCSYGMP
jgi:hypothetical protein